MFRQGVGIQENWGSCASSPDGVPRRFAVYVMSSDSGPDQAKCAKMISAELEPVPRAIFFHMPCLLHQIHLIVRTSLAKFPSYFASCAKVVNTWRSWGNTKKIRAAWREHFGDERAKVATSSLPPRPLRGRWGSIESIEQFLLKCGRHELITVYEEALLKKAKSVLAEGCPDMDDEVKKYQMEVGRWTVEAVEALKDDSFWASLLIGSISRGPICHTMAFLMKQNKENNDDSSRHMTVVNFVTSLVPRALLDFEHLLRSPECWYDLFSLDGATSETGSFNTANFSTLLCNADFVRRIADKANSYPLRLAWLLHRPETVCEKRKQVARDLQNFTAQMDGQPPLPSTTSASEAMRRSVEIHVSKLGTTFSSELAYCAETGLLHQKMQVFTAMLLSVMRLDTQAVEGLNSTIKLMSRAAPNLHAPLLSARLNVKTHVRQFGSTRAARAGLIDAAAGQHDRTKEWLAESCADKESRFTMQAIQEKPECLPDDLQALPGADAPTGVVRYIIGGPAAHKTHPRARRPSAEMCPAKMLLLFQGACRKQGIPLKPTEGRCFCFLGRKLASLTGGHQDDELPLTQTSMLWLGVMSLQHYSKFFWAECSLISEGADKQEPLYLKVITPVNHLDSLQVMGVLHDACDKSLLSITSEVWRVSWGRDGCVGEATVLERKPLDCNLIFGCKCEKNTRKPNSAPAAPAAGTVVGEGQVTYANDDEILESLAEQLLHGQDCNHETDLEDEHEVHSAESGMVSSDADADLQRLLEQVAAVCKVHPSTPTSFALHYVHVQIFRDSVLRGFICA